jgi:hypothetical protein
MIKIPLILLLFMAVGSYAQQGHQIIDYSIIKPSKWVISKTDTLDYAVGSYLGKSAFFLKRNFANSKSASIAYPKNLEFKDGIIELDIASPEGKYGFVGLAFRIMDPHHYETLYFRPGSSGTINAIQYMPEKKSEFNWWDYEADKFQAKAILPENQWFHVKAIVKGRQLSVFVDNQPQPLMVRKDLDHSLKSGSVGFWLGNSSSGAYKNLKVKIINN